MRAKIDTHTLPSGIEFRLIEDSTGSDRSFDVEIVSPVGSILTPNGSKITLLSADQKKATDLYISLLHNCMEVVISGGE